MLVAGVPVDAPAMHAAIEAEGAVVVAELSPFGCCGTSADVELADDPFAALANHYGRESIDARLPVNILMRKLDDAARRGASRRPLAAARRRELRLGLSARSRAARSPLDSARRAQRRSRVRRDSRGSRTHPLAAR